MGERGLEVPRRRRLLHRPLRQHGGRHRYREAEALGDRHRDRQDQAHAHPPDRPHRLRRRGQARVHAPAHGRPGQGLRGPRHLQGRELGRGVGRLGRQEGDRRDGLEQGERCAQDHLRRGQRDGAPGAAAPALHEDGARDDQEGHHGERDLRRQGDGGGAPDVAGDGEARRRRLHADRPLGRRDHDRDSDGQEAPGAQHEAERHVRPVREEGRGRGHQPVGPGRKLARERRHLQPRPAGAREVLEWLQLRFVGPDRRVQGKGLQARGGQEGRPAQGAPGDEPRGKEGVPREEGAGTRGTPEGDQRAGRRASEVHRRRG